MAFLKYEIRGKQMAAGNYENCPYQVPGDSYIMQLEPKGVRVWYNLSFDTNNLLKKINSGWVQIMILFATELKPLPEYFKHDGSGELLDQYELKLIGAMPPSTSEGKLPNGQFKMDYYASMPYIPGTSRHGIINQPVLQAFHEVNFGYPLFNQNGQLSQPIIFDLEYLVEPEFTVKIIPVNFAGTESLLQFADQSKAWQTSNLLTFQNRENNKVYVRDSAGTITGIDIDPKQWDVPLLP